MIWQQSYLLFGHGLAFSFFLAALPIFIVLLMLGVLRRPAWQAGLCGLIVSLALAVFGYKMPLVTAVSSALNGAAFGLFPILWIIFWAIVLFRITVETGQFEVIKNSIGRLTPDPRLQALLIAFAFSGFLEGAAGFGTPVAIAATMLIGLGFSPFSAAALCLLANTAPVAFGSIGIPVITLAGTTGLSVTKLSAAVGALCAPITFIVPTYIILAVGGFASTDGIIVPLLLTGGVCGVVQFCVSNYLGPQLTDILAGLCTMAALVLLLRFRRARASAPVANEGKTAMLLRFARRGSDGAHDAELVIEEKTIPTYTAGEVFHAWAPYGILVAFVLLWGWPPLTHLLDKVTVVIPWPQLHNVVQKMTPIVHKPTPYGALFTFNFLSASGTSCLCATLCSVWLLRMKPAQFFSILAGVVRQLRKPTATIASVLGMAFLMNYSGATVTLGLAFAATGALFPFFSALLGWLGVFLTGSDTSANALFGNLQVVTANRLGFDPVLLAAANSAGGVMGKMISIQTIAIAAAATGLSVAEQSRLFRFTLKHSVVLAFVAGGLAILYAHVLHAY
ncbi:lactate permease [Granulicella rosea]|uniref:L-lactate permease n=1 Tax=Granulicella rosea TaxID=474952 RepID=A0A239M4L4_9BACT|nr:lactate permease LctP family transporter [Granulicella rosea]SNT36934.1 lactate permease [Granulicella rosea]